MNILQKLSRRAGSYKAIFNPSGDLAPAADVVLRDLAQYCYAGKPTLKVSPVTGTADPLAMAFAEGRRDVFNRIVSLCNLTQSQIEAIANARSSNDA